MAYSALPDIMKTLLIKRLDSSFQAFKKTLENLFFQLSSKVSQFDNQLIYIFADVKKIDIATYILEDNEAALEDLLLKNKDSGQVYKPENFEEGYYDNIKSDLNIVQDLFERWKKVKEDPKYNVFLDNLKNQFFKKEINNKKSNLILKLSFTPLILVSLVLPNLIYSNRKCKKE